MIEGGHHETLRWTPFMGLVVAWTGDSRNPLKGPLSAILEGKQAMNVRNTKKMLVLDCLQSNDNSSFVTQASQGLVSRYLNTYPTPAGQCPLPELSAVGLVG